MVRLWYPWGFLSGSLLSRLLSVIHNITRSLVGYVFAMSLHESIDKNNRQYRYLPVKNIRLNDPFALLRSVLPLAYLPYEYSSASVKVMKITMNTLNKWVKSAVFIVTVCSSWCLIQFKMHCGLKGPFIAMQLNSTSS